MRRRELLAGGLAAGAALALPAPAAAQTGPSFRHGVASGDPLPDRVVLWTRISGAGSGPVPVRWVVATDPGLTAVVAEGSAEAGPERDGCVAVDAGGLTAATTYYFRFSLADGRSSGVGRTLTARAPDDPGEVRLGVVSCSSFAAGAFVAYARLAERDVDLVVHLGDYLYEAATAEETVRAHEPAAVPVDLAGYRARHAQQRSDPDLQRLTATAPLAAIWDDHEVLNDAWQGGAPGHDPARDGPWELRRAAALRAFLEWVPVRRPDPEAPERIWRSLPLGGAGELLLLDTRHDGRDRQVSPSDPDPAAAVADPARSLLSPAQRGWLEERLRSSPAAWRVVANQVVLSPTRFPAPGPLGDLAERVGLVVDGEVLNPDAWDGYGADQDRVTGWLGEEAVGPSVVLTGDVHSSWALEVPGPDGPVAAELVVPSVTSLSFADQVGGSSLVGDALGSAVEAAVDHLRWVELSEHGYVVAAVAPDRVSADWWHVDLDTGEEARAASWAVPAAGPRLEEAEPLPDRAGPPAPPDLPPEPPRRGEDGPPWAAIGLGGALAAAAVGGVVALRRRREDDDDDEDEDEDDDD